MSSQPLNVRDEFLRITDTVSKPNAEGKFATPADGAKWMASLGIPQVPLSAPTDRRRGSPGKNPAINGKNWHQKATTDFAQIDAWAKQFPKCNFGSLAQARIGGFYVLETDSGELSQKIEEDTGRAFEAQLLIESSAPDRHHRWYRHSAESLAELRNVGQAGATGWSLRCDNGQCVSPGSIHASGKQYRIVVKGAPTPQPPDEIRWLLAQKNQSTPRAPKPNGERQLIPPGGHHAALLRELGSLFNRGYSKHSAQQALLLWAHECLENPGHGEPIEVHVRKMVESTADWDRGNPGANFANDQNSFSESGSSPGVKMSESRSQQPTLPDEALYGLAGDIVRKIMPETESHPAGLLVQALMFFGNIIGRSAYFQVESTRHYGNLFAVQVGDSSKGRKGTGSNRINAVYEHVDGYWFENRMRSGLSSGEGLIVAVQDAVFEEGDLGVAEIIEDGVRDKRLLAQESEFAQLLAVMQRQGATITTNLRNAWDGKPLRTMTIRPRVATNHHISIMGDITAGELKHMLSQQDIGNGFANRFLWVHVERTKLLPFGGDELDFTPEVKRLQSAIKLAKNKKRIFMDENARKIWGRLYEDMAVDHGGLFGAVTSRGEAQIIRLALLYALMDTSDHIRSEHLRAAVALWRYCEDSARYIFDALTPEQVRMLDYVQKTARSPKPIS